MQCVYKKIIICVFVIATILLLTTLLILKQENMNNDNVKNNNSLIELPNPVLRGDVSIEQLISERRSIRNYKDKPLSLQQVSQILWASQGITDFNSGFRAAPSAGALYPLSVHIVVEKVENLDQGIYKYTAKGHSLKLEKKGSFRNDVYEKALMQQSIKESSLVLIISGDYEITEKVYGERAQRYVHMEAGHIGQNIYLQAEALGLGTVAIGAFDDEKIKAIINLEKETPLYIFPIGKK